MRKFFVLGLLLVALPAAAQSWSRPVKELSAASASTAAGASSTTGVDVSSGTSVLFHVSSAASAISVAFQESVDGAAWYSPVTVTTATAAGEMWVCPAARHARFYINSKAGDGALSGWISYRTIAGDPVGTGCHRIETYGGLASASGTGVISVAAGKTAAISNGLTFAGTDSTTMTFPTTSATIARTDAANTFTGTHTFGQVTDSGLTITRVPFASTSGLLIDKATFTFTTSTDTLLSGSYVTANNGKVSSPHFLSIDGAGGAPTVAGTTSNACGTTAPAIAGKDQAATITVGATSGTSCTVTFGTAWSVNVPACTASTNGTSTVTSVTPSLTTVVIAGTFTAGDKIGYICLGY